MDPRRTLRVAEALREELGELIEYELTDPRIAGTVVTGVDISPDFRHAHVTLSLPGDEASQQAALHAIEGARNYLKREIGSRLELFRMPDLHFQAGLPAALSGRLGAIMRRVRKGRPKDADGEAKKNPSE